MPLIALNDRVVAILERLMVSQKVKIKNSVERIRNIDIGKIVSFKIDSVYQHTGYGGTTYIVQANLSTTRADVILGGMVIKFCKNLEEEQLNAERLHQLLQIRQQQWESAATEELPIIIKSFPEIIYAPAVLETIELSAGQDNINCLMLEFVEQGIPLIDSKERGGFPEKLRLLGYSLARLHGTKSLRTEMMLYEPLFEHIKGLANEQSLTSWTDVFRQSKGSVEVIHGDSHLQNILKSGSDIAWIDAMMVAKSERMDDVGYSLSYLLQKELRDYLRNSNDDPKSIIQQCVHNAVENWVPAVLQGYQATININSLYHYLPLDFFLGSHLIIRSELWSDETMKWMLKESGRYFIEQWPINKYYKLI